MEIHGVVWKLGPIRLLPVCLLAASALQGPLQSISVELEKLEDWCCGAVTCSWGSHGPLHSCNSEWVLVLFGIPTCRCDASLRRRIVSVVMLLCGLASFRLGVGTPAVGSAMMAMAIRVATLLFLLIDVGFDSPHAIRMAIRIAFGVQHAAEFCFVERDPCRFFHWCHRIKADRRGLEIASRVVLLLFGGVSGPIFFGRLLR